MSSFLGEIYIWKQNEFIRACFIYNGGFRNYAVVNDEETLTNHAINEKITKWVEVGFDIKIGLPPPIPSLNRKRGET
jgi:hypothetical protein